MASVILVQVSFYAVFYSANAGMMLQFMVRNNNKGKEAFNVRLVGEQPRVQGRVKSYNGDRGFGWLSTKVLNVPFFFLLSCRILRLTCLFTSTNFDIIMWNT